MSSQLQHILNRLLIGGTWQAPSAIVNRFLPNLLVLVLAALIRPEELGVYSYILACYTVLSLFADMGIAYALQKFIPEHPGDAKRIAFTSLVLRFLCSVVLGLICLAVDYGFAVFKGYGFYILLLLTSSSFGVPIYVLNAWLKYKEVSLYAIFRGIFWFVLAIVLVQVGQPISGPIVSLAVSFIVVGALALWRGRSYFSFPFVGSYAKEIIKFGVLMTGASAFSALITQAGIIVLAYLTPESEVGVYRLASTLGMAPMILGDALVLPLLPLVKKGLINAPQDIPELLRLLIRYLSVISLFVFGTGVVLVKPLIGFLGSTYQDAVLISRVLLGAGLLGLFFSVLLSISYMSGDQKLGIKLNSVVAGICIGLTLILVSSQGARGAAIALLVAFGTGLILTAAWLVSRFRVRFEWRKYGIYVLSLAEMVGVLIVVMARLSNPFSRLIGGIILAPVIYSLALFVQGGISRKEIDRLLEVLKAGG